ncbi:CPBP family intramembrane glutamic endopeptidase [Halonotius roseus]|uniref:CPBP family intramembrane metalloprotease n=1 Tax=Halonotius roseus TaxID=2511997 RepID=A0A544QQJ5_9EURY|nr:type II CAAX endopeptidase family protein [Halonotius roseus]TQQ81709.1 CPBP family intramembrane metalloprotease [Halonotius roseus]
MSIRRISLIDSHPVASFFVLAYAITWSLSAPALFLEESWSAWILIYIGSFGPPVSAALVTWVRGDDLKIWASQIIRWRVGWPWWVAAFGIPLAIVGITTALLVVIGGPVDLAQPAQSPVLIAIVFLFGLTVSGGLNEEPGWRGFAQPYLNDRFSALTASLIIGVIWAGWHLPYFVIPFTPHSSFTFANQLGWFLGIILLSVILGWAYNNTGSVLIVMVLHAMVNTADILLPLAPDQLLIGGVPNETAITTITATQLAVQLLVVIAIVAYSGSKSLARKSIPGRAFLTGNR